MCKHPGSHLHFPRTSLQLPSIPPACPADVAPIIISFVCKVPVPVVVQKVGRVWAQPGRRGCNCGGAGCCCTLVIARRNRKAQRCGICVAV